MSAQSLPTSACLPEDTALLLTLVTDPSEIGGAGLLIDSLRSFGGRLCRSPIWVFYPAGLDLAVGPLFKPGVRTIPLELAEPFRSFPLASEMLPSTRPMWTGGLSYGW